MKVPLEKFLRSKEKVQQNFFTVYENRRHLVDPRSSKFIMIPEGKIFRLSDDFQALIKWIVKFIIDKHEEGRSCEGVINVGNICFYNGNLKNPSFLDMNGSSLPEYSSTYGPYHGRRDADYQDLQNLIKTILERAEFSTDNNDELKTFFTAIQNRSEVHILHHWALWDANERKSFISNFQVYREEKVVYNRILKLLGKKYHNISYESYLPSSGALRGVYKDKKANYNPCDVTDIPHFMRNVYEHYHEHCARGSAGVGTIEMELHTSFPTIINALCELIGDELIQTYWIG